MKKEVSIVKFLPKICKKKGASHVEFVLSFVIFVVFLIFLYNGLEPIVESAGSKQFILGHLKLSLVENLTLSDFTIQTFTISVSSGTLDCDEGEENCKNCIRIQEGGLLDLIEVDQENTNLTIKNEFGEILNYSIPQRNTILIGPNEKIGGGFLKVYFASKFLNRSPELQDENGNPIPPGQCLNLDEDEYELKTVTEREIIASTNIFDIKQWYEENYDDLSFSLGVPSGSDWNFEFQTIEFLDGDKNALIRPDPFLEPPENTNVYVGEFPIQYIDEEATIKIGFIRVTVW